MTLAMWIVVAVAALPVVLLLTTAGCAAIAGVELPPMRYEGFVRATHGVIGFWPLSEWKSELAKNPPVAANVEDNKYNGVYVNPGDITLEAPGAIDTSLDNRCAFFKGDGGHVRVPFPGQLDQPSPELSIELWVYATEHDRYWAVVAGCYDADDAESPLRSGFRIRVATQDMHDANPSPATHLEASVAGLTTPLGGSSRNIGFFFHVVLTATTNEVVLYLNGKKHSSKTSAEQGTPFAPIPKIVVPLLFAADQAVQAPTFRGRIDDVSLYASVLSANTVKQHYDEGRRLREYA
ncbi:hypothetical protein A5662_18955 [Mycobacteriaceae bacterium 1482268.1]|nr:hypothetical protein A5662_18955 [Mycobacteriaceae bacterium 1482268.1]